MTYTNHFEIEVKRPGGKWEHVGNVYPKYEWGVRRPWYFLGLVRRPVITNDARKEASLAGDSILVKMAELHTCQRPDSIRVWAWRRGWFNRLRKTLVAEWRCSQF